MSEDQAQEIAIEDFFELCKKGGTYQIETPNGWQDIGSLVQKNNKECYNLVLENGMQLGCSFDHYVWTSNIINHICAWKKAEDINVQTDFVHTNQADELRWQKVVAKESIGIKNTFDLEVKSHDHSYYSNGIMSHNTGKSATCDALADLYQMPLLRLDFGAIFASHVGESEKNIRTCLQTAEAIAPCVLGSTHISIKGRSSEIEDLFSKEESDSRNEITESQDKLQKVVYVNPDKKMTIDGTDKDGVVKALKINALIRHKKSERLIRIKTKSGKKIIVTQNHMLMDDDKNMKKAKNFAKGEAILTVCNNGMQGEVIEDEIESIEEIDFDGYVYDVSCENPHLYLTNDFISHNCILWIDEIEKGIGGVESSNSTDGGVTNRVFGTMLTWMQDKEAPVFVVCTANNIAGIPPEFIRAGRFDEIFFIDLPDDDQREEVIEKLLRRKGRQSADFNIELIVSASVNYTPVEIEKGIDNALFIAYADGKREMTTEDIVQSLSAFHPLYNSRREDIQRMRKWALGENGQGGRAILANSPSKTTEAVLTSAPGENEVSEIGRMIDLDI